MNSNTTIVHEIKFPLDLGQTVLAFGNNVCTKIAADVTAGYYPDGRPPFRIVADVPDMSTLFEMAFTESQIVSILRHFRFWLKGQYTIPHRFNDSPKY